MCIYTYSRAQQSNLVYLGIDEKLQYEYHPNTLESNQDNLMIDYSNCGYKGGGVKIPTPAVKITLYPQLGDDQERIQSAINYVSEMQPDENGIRGVILLKAGSYHLAEKLNNYNDALTIETGGVILRGEGQGADGTIIHTYFEEKHQTIGIRSPNPSFKTSFKTRITDDYVGSGVKEFEVENADNYEVGDTIQVRFTPNQTWLADIYANDYLSSGDEQWTASRYTINFERYITAIFSDIIEIHSPVILPVQSKYGGGEIHKISFESGKRIQNTGVENLRIVGTGITPTCAADNPNRLKTAVHFDHVENSWLRAVTVLHTSNSVVKTWNSHYITIEDCASLEPLGPKRGGYRYTFYYDAASSHNLCQRTYTCDGRHDYVLGPRIPGPNVFLDGYSLKGGTQGPHQRWATGTLFDNLKLASLIALEHRGSSGSGHGWAGIQSTIWNNEATSIICDAPKGFMNYAVGNKATEIKSHYISNSMPGVHRGYFDNHGTHVLPRSLYLQQLEDRLGKEAVQNITIQEQQTGNIYDMLANWAGEGALKDTTGVTLKAPQNFRPTDFSTTGGKFVTLEWNDVESDEAKFILERSSDGGENFTVIAELEPNIESFTDQDILQGDYHYRIKAINGDNFSAYNNFYVDLSSELATSEITFRVNLAEVADLYEGGNVWVKIDGQQEWQKMNDENGNKIYELTLPVAVEKNLKYLFIYQNGADFSTHFVEETVPDECADEGFRTIQEPENNLILPAVLFNTCNEALPPGMDITDLDNVMIHGSNDDEPWINGDEGAGSPPNERVEMLIDNDVETKYLVRAINSWVEINTDTLSKLNGYTITSANDVPARDPRSWELLGWDEDSQEWIIIHTVENNPSWPDFFTPKSWYVETDKWFKSYRLNITEINGDSQGLMQIAELQLWGTITPEITGINNKVNAREFTVEVYPNPINDKATIVVKLDNTNDISMFIYDAFGRTIKKFQEKRKDAGIHNMEWDASAVSPGVYYCRISINGNFITKKLIINR